jgi:hypothetical protein
MLRYGETVEQYVTSRCADIIETYKTIMTEYGMVSESNMRDVDRFYSQLVEALEATTFFEKYHGLQKRWRPIHRKMFKEFLRSSPELNYNVMKLVKPRTYEYNPVSAYPPNTLDKMLHNSKEAVRGASKKFKFHVTRKELDLNTILD